MEFSRRRPTIGTKKAAARTRAAFLDCLAAFVAASSGIMAETGIGGVHRMTDSIEA